MNVYQLAREQARLVFQVSRDFPPEERYSLTDQIRRSSRAVNAMVAEAWARRRYPADFISKLACALGEAMETQAGLDHALNCQYLTPGRHRELDAAGQSVGVRLSRMIERADDFCKSAKD